VASKQTQTGRGTRFQDCCVAACQCALPQQAFFASFSYPISGHIKQTNLIDD
jgi:hypothetical protein